MKILYYSPNPGVNTILPAGYNTHISEMIRAFKAMGHEVQDLIIGNRFLGNYVHETPAPQKSSTAKKGIKRIVPPKLWETTKDFRHLKRDRQFAVELDALIQTFQPDLIYERANYLQLSGVRTASKHNIPHLLEVNSPFTEERIRLGGDTYLKQLARRADRIMLEKTSKALMISSSLSENLSRNTGVDPSKAIVNPNAINPDLLQTDEINVIKIRDQYGLEGKRVLGFVGSFFKWHGIDLLIKAFSAISSEFKDTVLMIVGDGEIAAELKAQAAQTCPEGRVIFTGSVPHQAVFDHIENMDLVFMPNSNWYGSPVKIFEYGGMGKAIIAVDVGPIRDVLRPGKEGLLTPPDHKSMETAIRILLEHPDQQRMMADNFKSRVLSEHTWDQRAKAAIDSIRMDPPQKEMASRSSHQ